MSWPGNSNVLIIAERRTAKVSKYILNPGFPPLATTFLDLSAKSTIVTAPYNDFDGVTGMTFHPEFLTDPLKRFFYVRYTRNTDADMVIERYEVPPGWGVADPSTGQIMYEQAMEGTVHTSGQIHFDVLTSNKMYCAIGDGISPGAIGGQDKCDCEMRQCQEATSDLGKLVAFDVDGTIPWTPTHLAKGLRNPFAFSVDKGDSVGNGAGDVYVGTTGGLTTGDIFRWEAGTMGVLNWGWPWKVGDWVLGTGWQDANCQGDPNCGEPPGVSYTLPHQIVTDSFASPGVQDAVIGGIVYRGTDPDLAGLRGQYIFGQFGASGMQPKILRYDAANPSGGITDVSADLGFGPYWFFPPGSLHGFGQDWDGEIYVIRVKFPPPPPPDENPDGTIFKLVAE